MSDARGPGAAGPSDASVAALVEAIDARARQAGTESAALLLRGLLGTVSEELGSIQDRLDRVEHLLSAATEERSSPVAEGLAALDARLARLEKAVARPDDLSPVVERLDRLEDGVEHLRRDEASAAVVRLVEERLAAGMRAMAERADAVQRTVDGLAARLAENADAGAGAAEPGDPGAIAEIRDLVRAEAELLTQRVAALAVGVEATRALLEQHAADTEQTVGRRAADMTRRVAADFGLRTRNGGRSGGSSRRDPRELGPG